MKKILILIFVIVFFVFLQAKAEEQKKSFRIMTESDPRDYIGQNISWDFSNDNNSTITITEANEELATFRVEDFDTSYMTFEFASEEGKTISPGLYMPAKRSAFRGSYNGISISGDGRGCNEILGAFYVHEYVVNNGILEKAAIDFAQICEPDLNNLYNSNRPKLYGSLRYGSNISDSCNNQGCVAVKSNLGFTDIQSLTNNQQTINTNNTANDINNLPPVSGLTKSDAHKAIVKIKSYKLNEDSELALFSSGSGVIINSSGLVLTNRHVAIQEDDFDNTEIDSSYIICLTEEIDNEPECKYTAKLVASDKELDAALLKIDNIPGYSNKNTFSYLNLNSSDSISVNDEVTALGYPSIGGNTITITKGVISGKEDKHNKNWLKTDAIISYGSSGGAAIDSNAKLVGITSGSHSDTLSSLGYIINVSSLNSWMDSHIGENPRSNSLTVRTMDLAKGILNIKDKNEFTNSLPVYKITKPSNWDFIYEDETVLAVAKTSDESGGIILISSVKFPYIVDTGIVEGSIKRDLLFLISMASIVKNEDTTLNGNKAKKVIVSAVGEQQNYYYVPVDNYLLKIAYNYGENDKDKTIVDNMMNSIVVNSAGEYLEKREYAHINPKFNIKVSSDWALLVHNSKTTPLSIMYKPNKLAFVDLQIEKTDDNTKNLNNDAYLSYIEQKIKESNNLVNIYDIRKEILSKDAHYKLNNNLTDVIMLSSVDKSISTGQVLSQDRTYCIKAEDKYVYISLNYFSDEAEHYKDVLNKFNELVTPFNLVSSQAGSYTNISQEKIVKNTRMYNNLKGKIMLKVEDRGEAYYVHPTSKKMYYLGRPDDAFAVMREQGIGITNADLAKIPIGLKNLTGPDSDGDGLPDLFEDAIGTNKDKVDTDEDGHNDITELSEGYNPNGSGKLELNNNFSNPQKGKIFLQVEERGEAWYVNPNDSKRYFLGRPADAFQVMRNFGLGISNNDFDKF